MRVSTGCRRGARVRVQGSKVKSLAQARYMYSPRRKRFLCDFIDAFESSNPEMAQLSDNYEEKPSMERHIQYNKRGELRMVGQKSLFDLDEPVWHADEKVRVRGVKNNFVKNCSLFNSTVVSFLDDRMGCTDGRL